MKFYYALLPLLILTRNAYSQVDFAYSDSILFAGLRGELALYAPEGTHLTKQAILKQYIHVDTVIICICLPWKMIPARSAIGFPWK